MSLIGSTHSHLIAGRRSRALANHLCQFIPRGFHVLDVGCGDGLIDRIIMDQTGAVIEGIDTLIRHHTHIPVHTFNGLTFPYPDRSFDLVLLVDVLHHTQDPESLLAEAARVGRAILIKDHLRKGFYAKMTLRLMDWVGNAHFGVDLPYKYLSEAEWNNIFASANLRTQQTEKKLNLYPAPLSWFFDRDLHFITLCVPVEE